MLKDWKAFLTEKGAKFEDQHLVSFDNPESENSLLAQGSVLCDLSNFGIIKVSGEDAENFLQNQLTNDIRNVTESQHQSSAWCSPKGRMIANFQVFKRQESYFLILSIDLLEHVIKKLSMYIMMSKVTIENITDSYVLFGYAGTEADKNLQAYSKLTPLKANQSATFGTLTLLNMPTTLPGFIIFGELEDAKQLWEACNQTAKPASCAPFLYLNIISGLPIITKPSSEKWIPQMVNFTAIGGVDFKKGCYPGQEVVARLNYLGKTKRRMYRIEIDSNTLPAVNDNISSDTDPSAGQILNAAINPENKVEALAILKITEAEKPLSLEKCNSHVKILELPYTVEA